MAKGNKILKVLKLGESSTVDLWFTSVKRCSQSILWIHANYHSYYNNIMFLIQEKVSIILMYVSGQTHENDSSQLFANTEGLTKYISPNYLLVLCFHH